MAVVLARVEHTSLTLPQIWGGSRSDDRKVCAWRANVDDLAMLEELLEVEAAELVLERTRTREPTLSASPLELSLSANQRTVRARVTATSAKRDQRRKEDFWNATYTNGEAPVRSRRGASSRRAVHQMKEA